ncbi:tetratricopeptide repeat-containing response regulator [Mangrovitalea sediminis]|uniref:tetratricopeptide repeat-containing response regulator n=1 Tax=Mangrovitalea sediminis TaxID=1982043 RepID=UPI000BE61D22|nr:tetratricopeptide repeat-containing response regulator [Mangrovitalea sediminis]
MTTASDNPTELAKLYRKLRFLVVDDFENFRLSMKQMLRAFGADHIEVASNGNDAVSKCTYERFDIVLCDYNLGDGKNGQQILEELRHKKLLKHTSIFILVTAETSRDMVMGAREYQPDAYITKPITRAVLQKRLDALIEQRNVLYDINRELDVDNYPKAISQCLEAIPRLPRHRTWLLRTLADLYYQTGDYSHARKLYEDVLNSRDLPWARLGLGRVLLAEQQLDAASDLLKALIESHPESMEAYDLLAKVLQAQGKDRQAQQSLEEALRISPNAIVRQQSLATLATSNQDLDTAAKAWRSAVKLGNHSVHDSAENYLNLGRTLAELSDGDTSETGRNLAEEAMSTLHRMNRKYKDDEKAKLTGMLVESRVHAGQGRAQDSRRILEQVQASVDPDTLDADVGLEMARSLYVLGDTQAAEKLLNTLAQRFEDQPAIIQRIENLMDEPVSFQKRIRARGLNRDAIKAFEAGRLDEAATAFEEALSLVPRHPALNLNLVQVLLKRMETAGQDLASLRRCKNCLEQAEHIPSQHRQYKRLQFLKNKIEQMNRPGGAS